VQTIIYLLIRLGLLAAAFAFTSWILGDNFEVSGGFWGYVGAAFIFALVNAFIGPLFRLLALPFNVLTLGLFSLVVNGALLALASALTDAVDIEGFGWAMVAALILSIASTVLNGLVLGRR
jgi:putative membrane protein